MRSSHRWRSTSIMATCHRPVQMILPGGTYLVMPMVLSLSRNSIPPNITEAILSTLQQSLHCHHPRHRPTRNSTHTPCRCRHQWRLCKHGSLLHLYRHHAPNQAIHRLKHRQMYCYFARVLYSRILHFRNHTI